MYKGEPGHIQAHVIQHSTTQNPGHITLNALAIPQEKLKTRQLDIWQIVLEVI